MVLKARAWAPLGSPNVFAVQQPSVGEPVCNQASESALTTGGMVTK